MIAEDDPMSDEIPLRAPPRVRRVTVSGLELVGSIGIYERERRYEQRVVVSLDLTVADRYDGGSDDIRDVYDYDRAITIARRVLASRHFNLLETLAERIADGCLADPEVEVARVRVEKPDVIADGARVGIEIERRRPGRD